MHGDGTPLLQFHCASEHVSDRDAAGMVDGEGYSGVFTGPDFGCIHYEETQEQLPQDHPGYAMQQIKLAVRSASKVAESVSDQIKRGVIPRRPDGSVCC